MVQERFMLIWKSIIFTVLNPGIVIGGIPTLLFFLFRLYVRLNGFRYAGIAFIGIGFLFYVFSIISFINRGKGTPMIYFLEKTEKIFGKEPKKLVTSFLYKFSRNPMYFGVVLMTIGIGILLESISVMIWGLGIFLLFHLVVIKLEEPHLKEKYGVTYDQYCTNTPRWIGLKRIRSYSA